MKKILTAAAFTLALLMSFSATAFAIAFTDISGHRYEPDIKYIGDKGIVSGYADGTYKPDALISRAEFTKIIIGAKTNGVSLPDANNCFKDVKDEWFAIFACYAKDNGIISGYDDGTFRPTNNISIAEAAKIIIGGLMGSKITDTVGVEWFVPYMEKLSFYKAIPPTLQYKDAGTLITRGEMAFMIAALSTDANSATTQGNQYGDAKAEISIVTFTDFECPFCKTFHSVLKNIVDDSKGTVNLEYKNFPLSSHANADFEAATGECLAKVGTNDQYWEFIDKLFAGSYPDVDSIEAPVLATGVDIISFYDCVAEDNPWGHVDQDYALGQSIGVTATPSSVIINNTTGEFTAIEGNQTEKVVKDAIVKLQAK